MEYFLDMPAEYADYNFAKYVLQPVPYDGTSTWQKGADRGPQAIIDASDSIELLDVENQTQPYKVGIHTAKPITESASPEAMVKAVKQAVSQYLDNHKCVGLLGGEHSVSCGSIAAYKEKYPDLSVLQVDAHADLREEYHNSPYNHACVMRRVQTMGCPLIQCGIRNVCEEELPFVNEDRIFYAHHIRHSNDWQMNAVNKLSQHVYLTIDLDGFDPSLLPATGTPLPGGLDWWQVDDLIRLTAQHRHIVGFDVVELCPNDALKASDAIAATLVYRIISFIEKYAH